METKFEQIDLVALYSKAKAALEHCLAAEGNEFLNQEIEASISEIIVKDESVNIQFQAENKHNYTVEVRLLLLAQTEQKIGYYLYHENENEEQTDDYLVFE